MLVVTICISTSNPEFSYYTSSPTPDCVLFQFKEELLIFLPFFSLIQILERTLEPDSSDEEPPPVYSPPAYHLHMFDRPYLLAPPTPPPR